MDICPYKRKSRGGGSERTEQRQLLRCAPSPQPQPLSLCSRNPASWSGHTCPPRPLLTFCIWNDFRFALRLLTARVQAPFCIQAYVSTCMNPPFILHLLSLRELFVQGGELNLLITWAVRVFCCKWRDSRASCRPQCLSLDSALIYFKHTNVTFLYLICNILM